MRHGALALPAGAFALDQAVAVTETNFPDQIFRSWLLNKSNLNGAGADGLLTGEELASITVMDLSRRDIQSLEGIEYFTALESLNVSNNRLTSLNVSGCPELVDLNCERNRLTELDLSRNTKLVQLYCRHNSLTQLDVSRNLELVFIETFDNSLTSFDCSMLKKLEFLHIDYNRLTTLNMSGNPALKDSGFVAANNPLNTLVLPNIPNFTVDADVFYEQNPRTGYDNVEWYLDAAHTRPVAPGDKLPANGQTLYARWVPSPYTVYYRANGGQGTMEPQSAVYGASFALTPNAFTRTGYTFDHWSTYSDGVGGRVFENGATVQDLAGRNSSRTAVYLYAQWRSNTYTIRFSEGAAGDISAKYSESVALPADGPTADGMAFLGWSTKENDSQPEFFAGQPVRDLTAEDGGVVTLYPVWISHDEIQSSYREALRALVAGYSKDDYYTDDWNDIEAAAQTAESAIAAAGDDQSAMQQALNDAAKAMSTVPTCTARAEEIARAWQTGHAFILGKLNEPVSMAELDSCKTGADQAIADAAVDALKDKSPLSAPDNARAAAQALDLLAAPLARLQAMNSALGWMAQARSWYSMPAADVTSSTAAALDGLVQALDGLDTEARFFCDPAAVSSVSEKARLAREKAEALDELDREYARLIQWEYTEQNKQLLDDTAAAPEQADKRQSALLPQTRKGGAFLFSVSNVISGAPGQLDIVLVQHAEPPQISGLPGLCLAAEMQNAGVAHDPVHVAHAAAAQKIGVVVARVIVPKGVVQLHRALAIEGVQNVLVRQQQRLALLLGVAEDVLRTHLGPGRVQVDEQHAGVEIFAVGAKAHLVDIVHQARLARVGGGREQPSLQRCFPQRTQGVQHQDVRVDVEHPVQFRRKEAARQQPVIHLLGILPRDRGGIKHRPVHGEAVQGHAQPPALALHHFQRPGGNAAVQQPHRQQLVRVGGAQRGQKHLQRRQILPVQRHKNIDLVHFARSSCWRCSALPLSYSIFACISSTQSNVYARPRSVMPFSL